MSQRDENAASELRCILGGLGQDADKVARNLLEVALLAEFRKVDRSTQETTVRFLASCAEDELLRAERPALRLVSSRRRP